MNSYLAKEILIRHPPENFSVALACISVVKPKPDNMLLALGSALEASIESKSLEIASNSFNNFSPKLKLYFYVKK